LGVSKIEREVPHLGLQFLWKLLCHFDHFIKRLHILPHDLQSQYIRSSPQGQGRGSHFARFADFGLLFDPGLMAGSAPELGASR
jgi:hypothetical protein